MAVTEIKVKKSEVEAELKKIVKSLRDAGAEEVVYATKDLDDEHALLMVCPAKNAPDAPPGVTEAQLQQEGFQVGRTMASQVDVQQIQSGRAEREVDF